MTRANKEIIEVNSFVRGKENGASGRSFRNSSFGDIRVVLCILLQSAFRQTHKVYSVLGPRELSSSEGPSG